MAVNPDDIEFIIEIDADLASIAGDFSRMVQDAFNASASGVQTAMVDENGDIVDQVQWVAVLDGDTCVDCEDMDGEIFDAADVIDEPPIHPNCRCVLSPVIDEQSLQDIIANLA
jgi:SPP1 gp7 family putative phage head morphogenesis protein